MGNSSHCQGHRSSDHFYQNPELKIKGSKRINVKNHSEACRSQFRGTFLLDELNNTIALQLLQIQAECTLLRILALGDLQPHLCIGLHLVEALLYLLQVCRICSLIVHVKPLHNLHNDTLSGQVPSLTFTGAQPQIPQVMIRDSLHPGRVLHFCLDKKSRKHQGSASARELGERAPSPCECNTCNTQDTF